MTGDVDIVPFGVMYRNKQASISYDQIDSVNKFYQTRSTIDAEAMKKLGPQVLMVLEVPGSKDTVGD